MVGNGYYAIKTDLTKNVATEIISPSLSTKQRMKFLGLIIINDGLLIPIIKIYVDSDIVFINTMNANKSEKIWDKEEATIYCGKRIEILTNMDNTTAIALYSITG